MKTMAYNIFCRCFPQLPMKEEMFLKLIDFESCKLIPYYENEALAGYALIKGNCIRLLCVSPDYRGKGIGRVLMRQCENYIAENGYDKVILGDKASGFFIGAVTPEAQWNNMRNHFFEREGYCAQNGCLEMKMNLHGFNYDALDIPDCPDDVVFGYLDKSEKAELIAAVEKVSPEWVEYFTMESPVFAAKKDGRIVGFCIVDENADTIISTGENNVGVIGCVGVIPEMRRNGIGLRMVAKAMDEIKSNGCNDVFIHFTYLDWWYGKLGIRTFLYYWFGEKELKM